MARQISVTIYPYSELTGTARERARSWFIECMGDWWDSTENDALEVLSFLGFEEPKIGFSGFSCQGDGAHFAGRWRASKLDVDGLKGHAPIDEELHRIAAAMTAIAGTFPEATFTITHEGRYAHEYCTDFDFDMYGGDEDKAEAEESAPADQATRIAAEKELTELSRQLMRWVYKQLEEDYMARISEESVAEEMALNGYEFTAEGKVARG